MNAAIEALITETIQSLVLPSLCISVMRESTWSQCVGVADKDRDLAATSQTVYRLGSITKVFTALMLMQLVERGRVRLDESVARYLPAMQDLEAVTFKQLATHTSGLPTMPPSVTFPDSPDDILSVEFPSVATLIADLADVELVAPPVYEMHYSNWGVGLLGHVLSEIVGIPYREYVTEHILQPLGMTDTRFDVENGSHAVGYMTFSDPWLVMPPVDIAGFTPAGQLWSTLGDMTRFMAECLRPTGKVLNAESWELMRGPQVFNEEEQPVMAIGWRCTSINGETCIYHGGADPGYVSYLVLAPDKQAGVVLHTNAASDPGAIENLGNEILQSMLEDG